MQIKKAVLIIPYFGPFPAYFDLWRKSARMNPDFDFFIYTDNRLEEDEASNIKIIYTTFEAFRRRFQEKLGDHIHLKTPYKLCDYKPTYGYILEEDIKQYPFWGYCDVDLIFGQLNHFITDERLNRYDKFYFHGHFTLYRNNEKMNRLFMEHYANVVDYKHAFSTDYSCHFDESGTVAFADDYDDSVRVYKAWDFFDTMPGDYRIHRWGGKQRILCCLEARPSRVCGKGHA